MPPTRRAVEHKGQPTVILAKTIKGYGLGTAGEGMNVAHQQKKMVIEQLRAFRDRFAIPVSDADLEHVPFLRPPEDSAEMKYLRERVAALGSVPVRRRNVEAPLEVPDRSTPSRPCSKTRATARSRRRWRSSARSTSSRATRRSVRASSRSSPTSRARSGWKGCSGNSESTRASVSCTGRKTPSS